MSRSYHQKHPTKHNKDNRFPNVFLDKDGKIERHRKIKPYGLVFHTDEEEYLYRHGEVGVSIINKNKVRQNWKKEIIKILEQDKKY